MNLPAFLELSPGLTIWTIVIFTLFVAILGKYGWRPLRDSLKARQAAIEGAIESAERANAQAKVLLEESREKIAKAQQEALDVIRQGRSQAEAAIRAATEEADQVKKHKLAEAQRDIERQKDAAISQLRDEVSALVVTAAEKLIGKSLDADDHRRLVDQSLTDVSSN